MQEISGDVYLNKILEDNLQEQMKNIGKHPFLKEHLWKFLENIVAANS